MMQFIENHETCLYTEHVLCTGLFTLLTEVKDVNSPSFPLPGARMPLKSVRGLGLVEWIRAGASFCTRFFPPRASLSPLARVTARTGANLTAGCEASAAEKWGDDSDGGRGEGGVTGNPSEALLSLFNYHPSLALPASPLHTHTHTHTHAHKVGSWTEVTDPLRQGGFVQCGWWAESGHGGLAPVPYMLLVQQTFKSRLLPLLCPLPPPPPSYLSHPALFLPFISLSLSNPVPLALPLPLSLLLLLLLLFIPLLSSLSPLSPEQIRYMEYD